MTVMLTPSHPRCDYLTNPLGIDIARPRLSWILHSAQPDRRAQRQSAYQILVASTEDRLRAGQGDLWDSGRVETDQSVHVAYAGAGLRSGTTPLNRGGRAMVTGTGRMRHATGSRVLLTRPGAQDA